VPCAAGGDRVAVTPLHRLVLHHKTVLSHRTASMLLGIAQNVKNEFCLALNGLLCLDAPVASILILSLYRTVRLHSVKITGTSLNYFVFPDTSFLFVSFFFQPPTKSGIYFSLWHQSCKKFIWINSMDFYKVVRFDEPVKSQNYDGFVKSSQARRTNRVPTRRVGTEHLFRMRRNPEE
jgi:hypothetical protein